MSTRPRSEEGAGTIVAAAMLGLLVTVTLTVSAVTGVVAAHRRAQSAADLASLAGAAALQDGGGACERARLIATRNDARLRRCQVSGWNVLVEVSKAIRLPGGSMDLVARGRAGPVNG